MSSNSDTEPADRLPLTPRGMRTRARLVSAARAIFEADGYADARIADIAREAGVAYGTFYTYFATKEEIFGEVARAMQREMLIDAPVPAGDDGDGAAATHDLRLFDRIARANRRYLASYERHARLMAVIEQVALQNDELRQIRREVRSAFVERSTASIARWQAEGLADPRLDARYAASALGSMVDRFGYVWFVLEEDFEMETAIDTLTRLWIQALGMDPDAPSPGR